MTESFDAVAEDWLFTTDMAVVLFQNSPDAIVVVDTAGLIRIVNPQAGLLFGYTRGEMRRQPVEMLLPSDARGRHQAHRAAFLDDPRSRPMGIDLPLQALRKDGSTVAVDINLAPVVTDRGVFIIATVRRKRPLPAAGG